MLPRYPNITAKLVGENGNSFNLIGLVVKALKLNGVGEEEVRRFIREASEGSYVDMLRTISTWVEVE